MPPLRHGRSPVPTNIIFSCSTVSLQLKQWAVSESSVLKGWRTVQKVVTHGGEMVYPDVTLFSDLAMTLGVRPSSLVCARGVGAARILGVALRLGYWCQDFNSGMSARTRVIDQPESGEGGRRTSASMDDSAGSGSLRGSSWVGRAEQFWGALFCMPSQVDPRSTEEVPSLPTLRKGFFGKLPVSTLEKGFV